MLLDENPLAKGLGGIAIEHWNGPLQHDRASVEFGREEMHCDTCDLDSVLQGLTLSVNPRERGKERRVNVQNGVREGLEKRRAHQPHVAGQAHKTDIVRTQRSDHRAVVIVAGWCRSVIEAHHVNAGAPGELLPCGFWAIRDDDCDHGIQSSVSGGINQRL